MDAGAAFAELKEEFTALRMDVNSMGDTLSKVVIGQEALSRWRHEIDLKHSRIFGIGAGASAVFALLGTFCGTYIWFDVQHRYATLDQTVKQQAEIQQQVELLRHDVAILKGNL